MNKLIKNENHNENKANGISNRKMVPLRYVLMPIVIILIGLLILITVSIMAPKPAKKPLNLKAPLVDVIAIERNNITFKINSQGSIMPHTETTIISEVSGMIVEVADKFKVGGYFKKGEQLLAIDDITYQVALIQAQSRLDAAEASMMEENARTEQAKEEWLLTGRPLSEAPVLAIRIPQQKKAQADVLSAKADLKAAKIKLDKTKINAPYDALIKAKSVDIGQYVSTGSQLAQTFAVDYAEVRLPIKQQDLEFLNLPRINQVSEQVSPVELSYKIMGKYQKWSAVLSRYESVIDNSSRVQYVVAKIDDPYAINPLTKHKELHIGTFVNAEVTGKSLTDVTAIPRAVVYGANTLYLVNDNNQLEIRKITLLRSDIDYVYTTDKLDEGSRIVVTKLITPVEGMKLRVSSDDETKAQPHSQPKEKKQSLESEKKGEQAITKKTTEFEGSLALQGES